MNYAWTIKGVRDTDGLITQAMYHCRAEMQDLWVATEGTWFFAEPKLTVPYADVTEEMIVGWIKSEAFRDGKNMIESRLAEQIDNLATQAAPSLPWMPQVFTPKFEE